MHLLPLRPLLLLFLWPLAHLAALTSHTSSVNLTTRVRHLVALVLLPVEVDSVGCLADLGALVVEVVSALFPA